MIFHLLRSMCITGLAGVLAPIVVIGSILLLIVALGHVPGFVELSDDSKTHVLHFLNVFGSGNSIQGIGTLAIVSGSVAMLFDAYTRLVRLKPVR